MGGVSQKLLLQIDSFLEPSHFPLMGVVIESIDHSHKLYTYLNDFLVAVGHEGSDK